MRRIILATIAVTGLATGGGCVADDGSSTCRDVDGDGFGQKADPGCLFPQVDCNDSNPFANPGAPEICGNGLDDDCRGGDERCDDACRDADGDGYGEGAGCAGPDCDDFDPSAHPGAEEACDDGIDQDCDHADVRCPHGCRDTDGDGFGEGPDCWAPDCDDRDPAANPDALEACGDGVDQDCDGADRPCDVRCTDLDGDRFGEGPDCLGPDCDDGDPRVFQAADEVCGNGVDEDCDGLDRPCPPSCTDADGDGFGAGPGCWGPDCDDADSAANPDAAEICGDGTDNDCAGGDEACAPDCADADGDGFGVGPGCWGPDCDDAESAANPDAAEICGDGVDNDCAGGDEACAPDCTDADGDGFGAGPGCWGPDCDDSDDAVNPDSLERCGDGVDNDCRAGDERCGPRCGDGWVSLGTASASAMTVDGDAVSPDPDRGAPWVLLSDGSDTAWAHAVFELDPELAACVTSVSVYAYAYDDSWLGWGADMYTEGTGGSFRDNFIANVDAGERWYGAAFPATGRLACDPSACAVRVGVWAVSNDRTHLREIEVRVYLSSI
ncbi:MAG: putative metal-binding motif-containing protein [Deltaproteobacteria bacterium]|nr:putative metal-binding motif-containing protein [Deltaproteobacteria bacterium]